MISVRSFLFTVPLAGLLAMVGSLPGDEPTLSDLDALTARWIGLRGSLAEEARLWRDRKAAWEEEIELLEEEAAVLGEEVEATREVLTTAEERRADVMVRRENVEEELARVDAVLDAAVRRARELAPWVPEALREGMAADLVSMLDSGGEDLPRAQRAQRLVALMSTLESMQNRFHAVRETVEAVDGRRQVDVIYLGLARGFAVSPGDDWAAVGTPGGEGWTWSAGAVDPLEVRRLIEVFHRRRTATLAEVPLQVEEGL